MMMNNINVVVVSTDYRSSVCVLNTNVSLVNMITGGSRAHVSKKPGKTQTMNHYLIRTNHRATGDFYLVDLPGYGYAKASASSRVGWLQFTKDYFARRRQLLTVFVLVDSSVPVNDNDIMCLEWLAEHGVPSAVVFTKADKRDATRRGQTPDESEERDGGRAKSRVEKKAGNMRRFYDRLLVRHTPREDA